MLRNRPRAVTTSKQAALMADQSPQPSPTQKSYARQIQSFFGSPRFKDFTAKVLYDTDPVKSPTSILDTKPFFSFGFDITSQHKSPNISPGKPQKPRENLDPKRIGLALIDAISDNLPAGDEKDTTFGPHRRVLFGTKLRVEIPRDSPTVSPKSPTDFGIKTRNLRPPSCFPGIQTGDAVSPTAFTGFIPVSGMELSEDYTCVISHGPNPKTTHIFDNYIVESHWVLPEPNPAPGSFLSFCHTCKKNLEQKNDIFIYRGEKAFCSQECRYQEMLLDGEES